MPKHKRRLQFTEEETTGVKAEKLTAKTPKPKTGEKPKKQMKVKRTLDFEENKPKPSERLKDNAKELPGKAVTNRIRQKTEADADGNVSVQAVNEGSRQAENAVRTARTHVRRQTRKNTDESQKRMIREERAARRQEARIDRENLKERYAAYKRDHPEAKSNPYSRWRQKQEIKKEYYAVKHRGSSSAATSSFGGRFKESAKKATKETEKKIVAYVSEHKAATIAVLGVVLAIVIGIGVLGSVGGVLLQSGAGSVSMGTYASEDADMQSAEQQYLQLEANLQSTIDNYERTHSYDEYRYDLDAIGHDPYVLISYLSAKHGGSFTAGEVTGEVQEAFNRQYSLSQRVTRETRYRTETCYRVVTTTDEEGNAVQTLEPYTVQVPYNYYICTVTLRNRNLSHVPAELLTEDQLSLYSVYMSTLGNREDLFPGSEYIGRYDGEAAHYEIPPAYLSNERFAAMMAEADKYIGYPYVFGGSSPSTSFDCSGYVCWVLANHALDPSVFSGRFPAMLRHLP